MAEDALTNVLESMDNRKINLPKASALQGENIFYIEPKLNVAFAIMLKNERKKMGLSQKEVAKRLGIRWSAYRRIENPRKTNPTLSTISKLKTVFTDSTIFSF